MDLSSPLYALFPSTEALALQALISNPGPRSGREVARLAGVSHPAATRALRLLTEQGIVLSERASRANMYVLNEGHLALPSLRELAGLRALLVDRLRAETGRWELPALHVSLFGSVAKDGGDAESDVDLLVVRPSGVSPEEMVWRTQIEALSESVFDWTGNHAGLTEVDSSDLERAKDAGRSAWSSVMREGILLAGSSLRELTDRQPA